MADEPTQDGRACTLATPLGKDKLCLTRITVNEAVGTLFQVDIEALSTDGNIDFDKALGQNASVHLDTADPACAGRDFGGVLTQAQLIGRSGRFYAYGLILRPWLWLLSLTANCRIFSQQTPLDIINQIFNERGFSNFVVDLTARDFPTLEYCVQYRETDLNFVLRLMEEFGIYYYFLFKPPGKDASSPTDHYLVLADMDTHEPLPPPPNDFPFVPATTDKQLNEQRFDTWMKSRVMASGKYALNDYDYIKPNADLLAKWETPPYKYQHGQMEKFDYPGRYNDRSVGEKHAHFRWDGDRARDERRRAQGYAPSLTPGYTVSRSSKVLEDGNKITDGEDGKYLVLSCFHAYGPQDYETLAQDDTSAQYIGAYEFAKADAPYRMPLATPRPVIFGTQSAKVIAKKGEEKEEISVDEQGRILVEFYWDRAENYQENKKKPSRWVRVAQVWAGSDRGAFYLPRIGDEVLVAYEEGDPDRPIVIGSVYNGVNTDSLTLPTRKTVTGLLGKSSKDGGSSIHNANAWWFDDLKGREQFFVRARKDLYLRAYNNENVRIGGNVTETVGGDETITVGGPTGGGNFTLNAFQSVTINVGPTEAPPLTQIKMDTESITLSVGPGGLLAQIKMDASGVTISGTPVSQLMVQPSGITTMTPTLMFGIGPAVFASQVTIPIATIGAGTVGPLPII